MGASEEELKEMENIGEITAASIVGYFKDEEVQKELAELFALGVSPRFEESVKEGIFQGEQVVLTGSLTSFKRSEAQKLIEERGGACQSSVTAKTTLVVAGEAAGTFGVYRPGGSALNSTQVGSIRAAEHIAKCKERNANDTAFALPKIKYGKNNLSELREKYQSEMSNFADFDRSSEKMNQLFEDISHLCEKFFELAVIEDSSQISDLFKLYDMALTQKATLSAMICSAEVLGSHGSAFVDNKPNMTNEEIRRTRTITKNYIW